METVRVALPGASSHPPPRVSSRDQTNTRWGRCLHDRLEVAYSNSDSHREAVYFPALDRSRNGHLQPYVCLGAVVRWPSNQRTRRQRVRQNPLRGSCAVTGSLPVRSPYWDFSLSFSFIFNRHRSVGPAVRTWTFAACRNPDPASHLTRLVNCEANVRMDSPQMPLYPFYPSKHGGMSISCEM